MTRTKENRSVLIHRFAQLLVVCTFFLLIAGGLVTSTGSGLAVPDWPLSYGQLMPPMVGGIFYEHGHRMVATFVGFLTTILAIWLWKVEDRDWIRKLGFVALAGVIVQGLLGGLTVVLLLPTAVSASHATIAQSFFCLTIFIAMATSPAWRTTHQTEKSGIGKTKKLSLLLTITVFIQLILGALVRHTESALAIPDFPLSYGMLTPPIDASVVPSLNEDRLSWYDLGPVSLSQIWIHFIHRLWAVVVSIIAVVTVLDIYRNHSSETRLREPALFIGVLLVVQVFLGALVVWSGRTVETATAHVAVGALILGASFFLSVRTRRFYSPILQEELRIIPEMSRS